MKNTTANDKKTWSINKGAELKAKLDEALNFTLTSAQEITKLMDHYKINGLYNYSFFNSIMIAIQGGQMAQSFKRWQTLNRFVKKGEKANIYVYVPAFHKEKEKDAEEERKTLSYFMLKPVFDVSQTEGEPLKYAHNSLDTSAYNYDELATIISKLTDRPVLLEAMDEARGYCSPSKIAINEFSNNTDRIKTLLHEAGHALLKHDSKGNRGAEEVEAEAVAYLMMSFLDINFELSQAYINNWARTAKDVNKTAILKAVDQLIKAITPARAEELAEVA